MPTFASPSHTMGNSGRLSIMSATTLPGVRPAAKCCVRDAVRQLVHLREADRATLEHHERAIGTVGRALLEQIRDAVGLVTPVVEDPRVAAIQTLLRDLSRYDLACAHGNRNPPLHPTVPQRSTAAAQGVSSN